jgi:hypothetical protein
MLSSALFLNVSRGGTNHLASGLNSEILGPLLQFVEGRHILFYSNFYDVCTFVLTVDTNLTFNLLSITVN